VVLVELAVVEQRSRAVLEVLDGASVTEVARRFGVTRADGPCVVEPVRLPGWGGESGGPLEPAVLVSASDAPGGGGAGAGAAAGASGVGSGPDRPPAMQGAARAVADLLSGGTPTVWVHSSTNTETWTFDRDRSPSGGGAVESAADARGVPCRATTDVGRAVCVRDVLDVVGGAPVVLSAPGCLRAREDDSVEGRPHSPG
jgi:hypothetical protein